MIDSKLFEKILRISREKGIIDIFRPWIDKIPDSIIEKNNHIWLARDFNLEEIDIKSMIPLTLNFSHSEFEETFDWIKRNNLLWGDYEKEKQIAISEGHYWINAKLNKEIIAFIKFGTGEIFISDYKKTLSFPKNVVFLYETYVAPEARRKRVASYLVNETCKFCKKQGFTKAVTYVHSWNIASLKSMSNAGLREIKTIYYYKILGFKMLTYNPTKL